MSHLENLKARALKLQSKSKSHNTLLAYKKDWASFQTWCEKHEQTPFPASSETICLYMVDQSDTVAVPTIRNRLAAIRNFHIERDLVNPCDKEEIRRTMQGLTREKQHKPVQAAPLRQKDLERIESRIDLRNLHHVRDMAMLWTAFSGGLRRSELMALNVKDVHLPLKGAGHQEIKKSKTDQEGKGRHAALLPKAEPSRLYRRVICSNVMRLAHSHVFLLSRSPLFG